MNILCDDDLPKTESQPRDVRWWVDFVVIVDHKERLRTFTIFVMEWEGPAAPHKPLPPLAASTCVELRSASTFVHDVVIL